MNTKLLAELRAIRDSKPNKSAPRKSAPPATVHPQPIILAPGTISADHVSHGFHTSLVGKRGSIDGLKTKAGKSRATLPSNGDHLTYETHSTIVAKKGRSNRDTKPKGASNAPSLSGTQVHHETQVRIGANGEDSISMMEPMSASSLPTISDGHSQSETQSPHAVIGSGHSPSETQSALAAPDLISTIIELWKRRQAWHRAEKSLTLQSSAICRRYVGGDKTDAAKLLKRIEAGAIEEAAYMACFPLLTARDSISKNRKSIEKSLEKYAKQLPIATWFKSIRNAGWLSLYSLVGEMGDIGSYKSVSATWKRMGAAVIDGGRQRRVAGIDALAHGYSPQRRSVLWNIGSSIVGGMGKGPRPKLGEDTDARTDLTKYQKMFIREMRKWAVRDPDSHGRDPAEKGAELYESYSLHAANHARRVVSKEFLKDVFLEWRRHAKSVTQA